MTFSFHSYHSYLLCITYPVLLSTKPQQKHISCQPSLPFTQQLSCGCAVPLHELQRDAMVSSLPSVFLFAALLTSSFKPKEPFPFFPLTCCWRHSTGRTLPKKKFLCYFGKDDQTWTWRSDKLVVEYRLVLVFKDLFVALGRRAARPTGEYLESRQKSFQELGKWTKPCRITWQLLGPSPVLLCPPPQPHRTSPCVGTTA